MILLSNLQESVNSDENKVALSTFTSERQGLAAPVESNNGDNNA
jgi:hypothetical protein